MKNVLIVVQIIISVMLSAAILLQAKGTGLGTAFGGSNEQYRSKRGFEQLLYRGAIFLAILFLITSMAILILK